MKSRLPILMLLSFLLFAGCGGTKVIKFDDRQNEAFTTVNLKDFLSKNKSPKVVLRVSNTANNLTEMENVDYLYNAIENQLLSSGFIVRDRQLFNQIIDNENNNIDYEKIKEKTDTDLIIELTKLDPQVLYETNVYYDDKDRRKTDAYRTHQRYGANIEFKVITIEDNQFAGRYLFHYEPCTDGCIVEGSNSGMKAVKRGRSKPEEYVGVERDELEIFMKMATKNLVDEMRS